MKLSELTNVISIPDEYGHITFSGLSNDSRKIGPGDLFIAIPGYKTNGFLFLDEAIARGAVAAIVEQGLAGPSGFPTIPVDNARRTQGLVAAQFYGDPSRKLRIIGVTGTNGKTTVAHLIEHLLSADGDRVGLIGTVWIDNGLEIQRSKYTTPDSIDLQRILADMVANEVKTVVMEVSSHALSLDRVVGIEFDVAVLTNITHDHFDFHHNYQNYLDAKSLLFRELKFGAKTPKYAVINRDDESASKVAKNCKEPIFYYGTAPEADTRIEQVRHLDGQNLLTIKLANSRCQVTTNLPGGFNVYNILAAMTVAHQEGVPIAVMTAAMAQFPGVPGRYQEIECGQSFRVMVDFAHNPSALENILKMAGEQTAGRRIIVFGCEGEKDRLKRPLMGRIAIENSEVPILTSDNLYNEDINQIFEDVIAGLSDTAKAQLILEPNRHEAIAQAVAMAQPGDFVIVAGKGHEQYLIKGSERISFDDVEELRKILKPSDT